MLSFPLANKLKIRAYKYILNQTVRSFTPPRITQKMLEEFELDRIRNFCIIAHIDHGKSTLADRLLELTSTIDPNATQQQVLDTLQVEQDRGITVKSQTATMLYEHQNINYLLNLMDTPGHIDFTYEVSRSIRATQGALLLVDATKGIQAQTLSNYQQALQAGIKILPIINKIDLSNASIELTTKEIEENLDFGSAQISHISAKYGTGVEDVMSKIIHEIPSPESQIINEKTGELEDINQFGNFRAMIFDASYVQGKGVFIYINVLNGSIRKGSSIFSYYLDKKYEVFDVGIVNPKHSSTGYLGPGQVGYITTNMKTLQESKIGDTLYSIKTPKSQIPPFPGFQIPTPMVFAGIYPEEEEGFKDLESSIHKLLLTDTSIEIRGQHSQALGPGFRCGFLGVLHLEIFKDRLAAEYGVGALITRPNTAYRVVLKKGGYLEVHTPQDVEGILGDQILCWEEILAHATIIVPNAYHKEVTMLCLNSRGIEESVTYLDSGKVLLKYIIPYSELIYEFFDILKSITSGYASLEYVLGHYMQSDIHKVSFLVNHQPIDAFSSLIHASKSNKFAKTFCANLKELLHRELFAVPIQGLVEGKVIARETMKALKKDVTAKCYGGDVSRKRKLLDRQKKGKARMKQIGKVSISSEAFWKLAKTIN